MKVSIVQRYLAREILVAVAFVLVAFIGLFAFFDLVAELSDVGKNGYTFANAVVIVLLGLPGRCYELLPISALIGTIYALAQLASHSEFTILRVAGLSTQAAARMVLLPGLLLVFLTYFVGEVMTPKAESVAQRYRAEIARGTMSEAFKTGLWVKDTAVDAAGHPLVRFVNIAQVNPDHSLKRVHIYEFDRALRLRSIRFAAKGEYRSANEWRLQDVTETRFLTDGTIPVTPTSPPVAVDAMHLNDAADRASQGAATGPKAATRPADVTVVHVDEETWKSELNPEILGVLLFQPDRMAAADLESYIHHLQDNQQTAARYQIAFWKKLIYPFAVLVMMALGLPFAYLQARAGGISFKIFTGIMIGIGFYLLNSLFSHLGLINTWPPFVSAALPSAVFLAAALVALRWVER